MMRLGFFILLMLVWPGAVSLCNADVDPSDYEKKKADELVPMSVEEQKRASAAADPFDFEQLRLIRSAEEQQADSERKKREAEAEARRLVEEKAAFEALPYPVRLTALRCTECHTADNYMNQRHNRIGWELVTLRMQYLNGAKLGEGERSAIVQHLSQTYPAEGMDTVIETFMQLIVLIAPLAFWLGYRGVRGALFRRMHRG